MEGSSNTENDEWFVVGASEFRWSKSHLRFLSGSLKIGAIDHRPPLAWLAENIVRSCLLALGCLCVAFCGILGSPSIGLMGFLAACVLMMLTDIAVATLYFVAGLNREAFCFVVSAFAFSALAWSLGRQARLFSEACLAFGGLTLPSRILRDCVLFNDCSYLIEDIPLLEMVALLSGAVGVVLRQRFIRKAVLDAGSDRGAFQAAWARFEARTEEVESFTHMITAMFDGASARLAGPARQCNRQPRGPGTGPPEPTFCGGSRSVMPSDAGNPDDPAMHSSDTIAGQADRCRPITSLDQLYTQAMGVAPVLCGHCAAWARESGGCFNQADARRGSSGSGAADADGALSALPQVLRAWVQRGNVKRPQRAMEKALTCCYGGDVSRLLDVCRGRVVFGDAAGLRGCVQAIMRDSDAGLVRLVRVRNTLQQPHDVGCASSGFKVTAFSSQQFICTRV